MSWYPSAVKLELQPESDDQPAIRPTQFIMHSLAAPWGVRRTYEYWRDSTNLESHFAVDYTGEVGQFIGTQTRADANYGANLRPDGTGAVSVETASDLDTSDPWNSSQIEHLIALGAWLHREHGIPLRICRAHDDPGYGYHSLFPQWSTGGTTCPGRARILQFRAVVFPGIVAACRTSAPPPEETPVTLTQEEMIDQTATAAAEKVRWLKVDDPFKADASQITLGGLWWETASRIATLQSAPVPPLSDAQLTALADRIVSSPELSAALATALARLTVRLSAGTGA